MPYVLKTEKGSGRRHVVVGVGVVGEHGKGGIPIERAAERMPELQEKNPDGSLVTPRKPLRGEKLLAAARAWAKTRDLILVDLSEDEIEVLDQELGRPAPPPPARDVALGIAKRARGKVGFGLAEPEKEGEVPEPSVAGGSDEADEAEKPTRRSSRSGATKPEADKEVTTDEKEGEE